MTESLHPFARLTPDFLLDAVESVGVRASGSLMALNSYENRVYQVGLDDAPPLIAKFYRPGRWCREAILEEHAFSLELADAEIPVVPPLSFDGQTLFEHDGFLFSLFARRGGRPPELDNEDVLEWLGRFLGRIHALGACRPYAFRGTLDAESFGDAAVKTVLASGLLPPELIEPWQVVARQCVDAVRAAYARAGEVRLIRAHGDCHAGNLMWTDAGPHFVDLDDSRMAPAMQDIWMLLSGSRSEQQAQLAAVLAGYEDFAEFDVRELHLVEPLRTLRLIHYSAWLAARVDDPAFGSAFPWFGSQRYWEEQVLTLREQLGALSEPPLWGGNH